MKSVLFFLGCLPFIVQAQGIKFETGLSWEQVKAKAKRENKLIFMDCYTTWCGPCKYMSQNIFPEKSVGAFFNAKFINVAVQMDRTSKDSEVVKVWYSDVDQIKKSCNINVYPTYLFFGSDGNVVHRFIGATQNSEELIAKASDALDTGKQYSTLVSTWKLHKGDSAFLRDAIKTALAVDDNKTAFEMGDYYIDCLHDPLVKGNLEFYYPLITSSKSKGFLLLLKNSKGLDELMDNSEFVEWKLDAVISTEEIVPLFRNFDSSHVVWNELKQNLKRKYPDLEEPTIAFLYNSYTYCIRNGLRASLRKKDDSLPNWTRISNNLKMQFPEYNASRMLVEEKALFYSKHKMWTECASAAYELMKKYGDQLNDRDINNITWDYVFEHCSDRKIIREALLSIKHAVDLNPTQHNNIDTYANLLYKSGDRVNAISMEEKAIALWAKNKGYPNDLNDYKEHLEKIKKGQKTWQN